MRVLILLMLAGCEWVRLPVSYDLHDLDEDGYDSLQDCNDFNGHVHPFASEDCNGTDNNCSGDESDAVDAQVFYADFDGDGYGDGGAPILACDQPTGSSTIPMDCDDADRDVFPGAAELDCTDPVDRNCDGFPAWHDADQDGDPSCTDCDDRVESVHTGADEICNGRDDDCDDTIDEDLDATTWYLDFDEDGWGTDEITQEACARPIGYSASDGDCADTDAAIHPRASERCDGTDQDCDGEIDEYDAGGNERWYTDADEDGYGGGEWSASCTGVEGTVSVTGDCRDADPDIHPGADEHCDRIDEDCDAEIDESPVDGSTWFADADFDDWGDPAVTTQACTQAAGWVDNDGDCDDTDAGVSPDDDEVCGGGDEDCDGEIDEEGAVDGEAWYADLDGDGYGDPDDVVYACGTVAGRIADSQDCDDGDAEVYPGALELDCSDPVDYNCDGSVGHDDADGDGWDACEDCDDSDDSLNPGEPELCDGIDQDCDGTHDEDATDGDTWYADVDRDFYGDDDDALVTCSRPTGYTATNGDCDDTDAAVNPAAVETCATTADDDCDGDTEAAADCLDWYADDDGDGYGDPDDSTCRCTALAPWTLSDATDCLDSDADVNPVATEVCADGLDNDCDDAAPGCGLAGEVSLADTAPILGAAAGDGFGAAALAASIDGDGAIDLVVGAPEADDAGTDAGGLYLLDADSATAAGDAWATWTGETAGDLAGGAIARGDLDGDGLYELFVGGIGDDAGGTDGGAVWMLESPETGGTLGDADAKRIAEGAGDSLGAALAVVVGGATDGDDLLVAGAPRESTRSAGAGAVYGFDAVGGGSGASAEAWLVGNASGDRFGDALASAGDFDGDGFGDLVVGAYAADDGGTNAGAAWVFTGPLTGALDTTDAQVERTGGASSDSAGYAVAGGGDTDGDGYDDVWVGAFNNDYGGSGAGAAYLIAGGSRGTGALGDAAVVWGSTAADRVGIALAVGDFDGDGLFDAAIGGDGGSWGDTGVAWIFYGPATGVQSADDLDHRVLGETRGDGVGLGLWSVSLGGDGYDDLLLGATTRDEAGTDAGALYRVEGGPGL